jgi:ribosome-associated protein
MQEELPSKTRRKRAMRELQDLGAALLALPQPQLDAIALPEPLAEALAEARRIGSREARRRQLQYIGRLMREVDPEPVRAAILEAEGRSAAARARQRQLERWRERLIGDDDALTEFASAHPRTDLQSLRALIRSARREIAAARPPRAQRELFRLIRDAVERA